MSATPGATPRTTPGAAPRTTLHVGDLVVARLAARAARGVPGVAGLRPDLTQALLGVAGTVFGQQRDTLPADGATAVVEGGHADVSLTVLTRLGHNCRDLAAAVQRAVSAEVGAYTGLQVTVRVTIADVLI
ncbi:MAG: Asp23/Gls24 family envelope stress response protein [Pseudonocardia sp.]|nr:Asp23/Gls24 family envelope stress response protein [Pseudonocardia sp.]